MNVRSVLQLLRSRQEPVLYETVATPIRVKYRWGVCKD